jgi:hypothetical protein
VSGCLALQASEAPRAAEVASPDGRLKAAIRLTAEGEPRYSIRLDGKPDSQPRDAPANAGSCERWQ